MGERHKRGQCPQIMSSDFQQGRCLFLKEVWDSSYDKDWASLYLWQEEEDHRSLGSEFYEIRCHMVTRCSLNPAISQNCLATKSYLISLVDDCTSYASALLWVDKMQLGAWGGHSCCRRLSPTEKRLRSPINTAISNEVSTLQSLPFHISVDRDGQFPPQHPIIHCRDDIVIFYSQSMPCSTSPHRKTSNFLILQEMERRWTWGYRSEKEERSGRKEDMKGKDSSTTSTNKKV